MPEVVIGTSPSTGEVLVRDTATGGLSWQPGTPAQIAAVTGAIVGAEAGGAAYTPASYVPPTVPVPKPPVIPTIQFPTWSDILSFLSSWLTAALNAWNWVRDAFWNVWNIIDSWWDTKWPMVQGLISAATQGIAEAALNAWNWVRNSFWNVWGIVDSWWSVKQWEVRELINTATQGLSSLITTWSNFWGVTWPAWVSSFNSVKSAWDNFWSYTLPSLVSFSGLGTWWDSRLQDVQGLVSSAFTARDSLWAGWQDLRNEVATFVSDPVEYIWGRFTEWFLGPEV